MLIAGSIILGLIDSHWNSSGGPWYYFGASPGVFAVLAAVGVAVVLATVWALFIYKPSRRHLHLRRFGLSSPPERVSLQSANGQNGSDAEPRHHRRQWRRRRREHRPRNPTLAERGGLPPLRQERPSEPLP
jgi:hypothetical protein